MTAFGILVKFKRNVAMKKSIITLGAVALALVACNNKEQLDYVQNETVLTFSSEKPQLETETKTAWDAANQSIVWSSGDKIRVGYTLDGTWMGNNGAADSGADPIIPAKFYASTGVAIDATHANSGTFSVPSGFTGSPTGSAVFYSVYPSSCADTDADYAPSVTVKIKSSQTPGANTFDKDADIMIGQTEAIALSGAFPTSPLALEWNRIVAHADLTFTNLPINGDASVNKITLTFNNEAKVVGKAYVNVTTGVVNSTPASNQLEIRGDNLAFSGANNNNIEAWACVLPVEFTSVDVAVKTNLATYTRSITGISKSFKKNARNTLSINMASSTRTENTNVLDNGNYVLAVKDGENYYAISSAANGTSDRRDRFHITTDGFDPADYTVLSPYSAANSLIWTITNVSGGVKINLAGDTNSYMLYGDKKIPLGADGSVFEVDESAGTYTFTNSSKYISMNSTYGFGCYSSGDSYVKAIYVIPAVGTPAISFSETSKNVAASIASVVFPYTSVFLTDEPAVSVTSDEGGMVASTSIAAGSLTVNLNANTTSSAKTATLSVSATGVSPIVLTITQAAALTDAHNGDVLWAEAFTGFAANDVPSVSTANTIVYGNGSVSYSCHLSGTKIYTSGNMLAGGASPELLIAKEGGYFAVTGIPSGNATGMTLSFKSNNGCEVSSNTTGAVIGSNIGTGNNYVYSVTVPSATKTVNLTFTNSAGSNTRVDDFSLVAGAPVPGVTVATTAASATTTAGGTTATLNGTITLVNGAVIGSVTEAGFYYKLSSAADYTKVTCASVSTTAISYALTGLTAGSEYTYFAYAVYDSGSEVTGKASEQTFTPTLSGNTKNYTLTITSDDLVVLDSSASGSYDKYKGDQTFTAVADDSSELPVVVNITDIMPGSGGNAGKLQLKKNNAGVLYNKTNLGSITSITIADNLSLQKYIGTTQNPSSNAGSGGYFKIVNNNSSAGYTSSITITFTK